MARPAADRVKAVWTGTGTGTMTLGGAASGEPVQGFPASLDGQVVRYLIKHETAQEAEAGFGTYTSASGQLTRTYRTYPTPGGSAVNFSAGTKHVSVTPLHSDFTPNITTTDPDPETDNITSGYLQGHEWINTSTGAIWKCVDHGVGSPNTTTWVRIDSAGASLDQYDIAARLAAGTGGFVGVAAGDLTEEGTPEAGDFLLGWASGSVLRKFDVGDLPVGSGDVAPSTVTSNASPFALATTSRVSNNVVVLSHQASVVFEVPQAAAAGSQWLIMPSSAHTGCTVTINGGVGTLTPNPARIIAGGLVVVTVRSNAGSAPVAEVRGNVIVPSTAVTTRTYAIDDHGQEFEATGTQTFNIATASLPSGWTIPAIWNASAGNINIVGLDATHVLPPKGAVTVKRFAGGPLVCIGSSTGSTVTVLDAA